MPRFWSLRNELPTYLFTYLFNWVVGGGGWWIPKIEPFNAATTNPNVGGTPFLNVFIFVYLSI